MDARIVDGVFGTGVAGIAVFDQRLCCVQANAELARLARTTPTQLIGRSFQELLGGRRPEELAAITRVLATGAPLVDRSVETETLTLRVDYLPLRGDSPQPTGVMVVAVDLSAQRRAEAALATRLATSELISELSASFIDLPASDIDGGIERAMGVIGARLALDGAHLGILASDRTTWRMTHQWVSAPNAPSIQRFQDLDIGAFPWSAQRLLAGEPVLVHDIEEMPPEAERERDNHRALGDRAFATLPLVHAGTTVGFIAFTSAEPRRWTAEVVASLRLVAEILSNAIDRKQSDTALRERLGFEEALSVIATRFISASVDAVDGAIEEALRVLGETLRYHRTAVFLLDERREQMELAFEWCGPGVRPLRASKAGVGIQELLATLSTVPMRIEERVIGCVGFQSRAGRALDDAMVARLRLVGDIICGAIARKRAELARRAAFAQLEKLKTQAERERDYLREEAGGTRLIGDSPELARLLETLDVVAATGATVLIRGESGVGKELIARAIHERSPRHAAPLVKVNCASVPKELFESEFFGHVRGAFTGAFRDRAGRFELADGGTLFLDEVGDIPLDLQAKLLRVLQESELERVGDDKTRKVDVRIVAATNRNLEADVLEGRFRQDLYYRLSVFPLEVPPLRARKGDIVPLAEHFLRVCSLKIGRAGLALSDAQRRQLTEYDWPGNVRELQHVIERAVILSPAPPLQLERALTVAAPASAPLPPTKPRGEAQPILTESDLRALERDSIVAALDRAAGRIAGPGGAAEILGVRPSTLRDRMKALGIQRPA